MATTTATKKTRSERDRFMTDYLIRKESERRLREREESQKKVDNVKSETATSLPCRRTE